MQPDDEVERIEVALLLEAVYAKYGYDLRGYTRASMHRRVLAALDKSGLTKLSDLQHRILRDPPFFTEVLTDLTVQVTEMFRNPDVFRTFREEVVPLLRTYPLLRIWHAGCATGEEAYSTAILLSEEGLYERAQIYATDLSAHAIERAKCGVYPASQRAMFEENHRRSGGSTSLSPYLTERYDCLAIHEGLRRNILFFQHNLASDHTFGEMHVIFCRNVLIYLGAELRLRVLQRFAASVVAGGFLCLGRSERVAPELRELFCPFGGEQRIYRQSGMSHRTS
jgi:chemotaxis protein methyltransferase CheR